MRTFEIKVVITNLDDNSDIESLLEKVQANIYDGLEDGEELDSIEGQELNPKIYLDDE